MKRRTLKKYINSTSEELILETCVISSLVPNVNTEKTELLLIKIENFNQEFISRICTYGGKKDKKLVKKYFNKIVEDWKKSIIEISEDLQNLNK